MDILNPSNNYSKQQIYSRKEYYSKLLTIGIIAFIFGALCMLAAISVADNYLNNNQVKTTIKP